MDPQTSDAAGGHEGLWLDDEARRQVSFTRDLRPDSGQSSPSGGKFSPRLGLSMSKNWRSEITSGGSSDVSGSGATGRLHRRGSIIAADTFAGGRKESKPSIQIKTDTFLGRARKAVAVVVEHNYLANFMGLVVLCDSYFTANDIDARAAVQGETDPIILLCSDICLVLYTIEIALMLWVIGLQVLKDWMVVLDMAIIFCGYVEMLFNRLEFSSELADRLGLLRVLRMARIVRIMQLLRKTRSLKELQKLVMMMATCLKALTWCFLFCFIIMTIWAMLLVEVVHPLIQNMNEAKGIFADCDQCLSSCESVMSANLLLFKTVIAGDSWGQIAVPVIQAYPSTAIIFVGSLLSLVFGVLNLIVAVVVDTFAEVRESDVMNLAEEMDHAVENDKKFLHRIFRRIDVEKKGELSLDDIMEGARNDPEFQSRLRVMDIDEVDLQQLFEMIDVDGSGTIEADEFIVPLSRWAHDSKTAPRFIKYNLMHAVQQQEDLMRSLDRHFSVLHARMDDLEERISPGQPGEQPVDFPHVSTQNDFLLRHLGATRTSGADSDEEVQPCRPSKLPEPLRPPDHAVKPAVAALQQRLTEALNASVERMEAILQEELKKNAEDRGQDERKEQLQAHVSERCRLSQRLQSV